jgi:hypothetical protein
MPLIRRRFRGTANGTPPGALVATLPLPNGWPASPIPVPKRNPQLRQKRSSDGIGEWQLEQVTVAPEVSGISEFCDIETHLLQGTVEEYTTFPIRLIIFRGCS